MVRHFFAIILLSLSLISPATAWAADFTASVSRKQVSVGEGFTLKLELLGTSPKRTPEIASLKQNFNVTGRGNSSNTTIINGHMSSSISWQYTLTPKAEGALIIPAINVETADGKISTQPITVSVGKATDVSPTDQNKSIFIQVDVNKRDPYKNEPIQYTVTLVSQYDITDVKLSELEVSDAIVETVEEPQIYDRVIDGIAVKAIEINYIITPLKSGVLTIPSIVIQGGIPVRSKSRFNSMFDHTMDPFSMLDNFGGMGAFGLGRQEPFRVASKPITLPIKPPVVGVNPWLPATSLQIEEQWDDTQGFKVGEPITRHFIINATGIASSQIPNLEAQVNKADDMKIYADNPVLKDNTKSNIIISQREESYTLIPQKEGAITLPEISVVWWDVEKGKTMYATVPARILQVAPGAQASQNFKEDKSVMKQAQKEPNHSDDEIAPLTSHTKKGNNFLYIAVAVLVGLLLMAFFWIVRLKRKMSGLNDNPTQKIMETKPKTKIGLKNLTQANSAEEVHHFLQRYAKSRWNTSENASLDSIFAVMKKNNPAVTKQADETLKQLQDTLYADKNIDLNMFKKACSALLTATEQDNNKTNKAKKGKLPTLNPS